MSSLTKISTNIILAVCCLFVAAVLMNGCTASRVNLEVEDVSVLPNLPSQVPSPKLMH